LFWRHPALLRTVIVNLKDEPTTAIRGVLWKQRGRWFTIVQAFALKAGHEPAQIDGDVVVDRDNISFYQVLP
jgi:hypothetical protein